MNSFLVSSSLSPYTPVAASSLLFFCFVLSCLLFFFQATFSLSSIMARRGLPGKGRTAGGMAHKQIYYSDKYDDEEFEYRHVMLPKDIAKLVPKTHLMSESEWRNLGVQQSQGWVHYMIHEPEPHILLFRRPLPKKPEK